MDSDVVVVTHLFPPERASLIELLSALAAEQWQAPTVCPGWSALPAPRWRPSRHARKAGWLPGAGGVP